MPELTPERIADYIAKGNPRSLLSQDAGLLIAQYNAHRRGGEEAMTRDQQGLWVTEAIATLAALCAEAARLPAPRDLIAAIQIAAEYHSLTPKQRSDWAARVIKMLDEGRAVLQEGDARLQRMALDDVTAWNLSMDIGSRPVTFKARRPAVG